MPLTTLKKAAKSAHRLGDGISHKTPDLQEPPLEFLGSSREVAHRLAPENGEWILLKSGVIFLACDSKVGAK